MTSKAASRHIILNVRIASAERTLFKLAADEHGLPVSAWLRMLGLTAAREVAEESRRKAQEERAQKAAPDAADPAADAQTAPETPS